MTQDDPRTAGDSTWRAGTPSGPGGGVDTTAPRLTVLMHPDPTRIGEQAALPGVDLGVPAEISRRAPAFASGGPRRPLDDRGVSRTPLVLGRAPGGGVRIAAPWDRVRARCDGAPIADRVDIGPAALDHGVVLRLADRVLLLLQRSADPTAGDDLGLVGPSAALAGVRERIRRLGPTELPVLVRGETGTGKELVARALHACSDRARRPLIALNMAAVPPSTAPSALFGHEGGAFTGATRTSGGYFGAADGGTLLLDEVGATPPPVQTLLLRALDDGSIQPVGGGLRAVDVRVIASTDADLEAEVAAGRFHAPLLHRLGGATIRIPPLRDRPEDVPMLLARFLAEAAARGATFGAEGPAVACERVERLVRRAWPGNVRALRHAARQLAATGEIDASADHPVAAAGSGSTSPTEAPRSSAASPPARRGLQGIDDDAIADALRREGWEIAPTARRLGVGKNTLARRMRRSPRFRRAVELDDAELRAAMRDVSTDPAALAEHFEVSERALRRRLAALEL